MEEKTNADEHTPNIIEQESVNSADGESQIMPEVHSAPPSPSLTNSITVRRVEPCMICTDDMIEEDLYFLQCFHRFHTRCISRWLTVKQQCPICKFPANIDIIGVDENGNFLSATGHTITNGIIEDREAIMQESMDTRISRAIDLLREMHSHNVTNPAARQPIRRRINLQVNVDTNPHDSDDESVYDSEDTHTENEPTGSSQDTTALDWESLLRHAQRPVNVYSSRRTRSAPIAEDIFRQEHKYSELNSSQDNQSEQENSFRTFGPIEDGEEENNEWVDNTVNNLMTHFSPSTTPLLPANRPYDNNTQNPIHNDVQLSQPRTPSPYPLFSLNQRSPFDQYSRISMAQDSPAYQATNSETDSDDSSDMSDYVYYSDSLQDNS